MNFRLLSDDELHHVLAADVVVKLAHHAALAILEPEIFKSCTNTTPFKITSYSSYYFRITPASTSLFANAVCVTGGDAVSSNTRE